MPLAAIVACLALGEAAARIGGGRPVSRLAAHRDRGWAPAPGTRESGRVTATVSPSGTRGPEGAPGGILILGDEVAFGAGVRDGDTLGAVVGRERSGPVTLAACEGYGTAQEVLWLRELAPRLKPSAVVVVFSYDDPRIFAATLFTHLRFSIQRFSALAAGAFPGTRPASRAELSELYTPDGIPWRFLEDQMRALGAWSRENRTPVVLSIWPVMTRQDDALGEYFEQVRGAAREHGLLVHNLLDDLGAEPLDTLLLPGGRPGPEAYRRAGAGIAAFLRDSLTR